MQNILPMILKTQKSISLENFIRRHEIIKASIVSKNNGKIKLFHFYFKVI